jgi:hypothetical protein
MAEQLEGGAPLTMCWCCDRLLGVGGAGGRPGPGDMAVCSWCGALAMVGPDLATEAPSDELLEQLASNPDWRARYVASLRRAKWLEDR